MESPADKRLLELLDKWLASLELHIKYSTLDDDRYWQIQGWIEHQRPTRWILDLAKQKTLALKTHVEERIAAGDTRFSESLELMIFLANLVGSEHIERFIPLAEQTAESAAVTGTREMPQFVADARPAAAVAPAAEVARVERKKSAAKQPAAAGGTREQVVADAIRLVEWGRKWYELPELVARMAGRPSLPEVRKILKENKSTIDEKSGKTKSRDR